jgi:hypothetical protein
MTTKKNLVKSMFMNILTAGIFATAFTACSDEIDVEQAPTAEPTTHKTRSFITDDYYNINEKCATPFTRDNWYTHNGIYMRTGNGSFVNPNIKDPEQRTGYCEEILWRLPPPQCQLHGVLQQVSGQTPLFLLHTARRTDQ